MREKRQLFILRKYICPSADAPADPAEGAGSTAAEETLGKNKPVGVNLNIIFINIDEWDVRPRYNLHLTPQEKFL